MVEKAGIALRREEIRKQFWPDDDLWTGENEKGWFAAPRTLPLILSLLASKSISPQKQHPSSVYLELISRQVSEGIVEMAHEREHAFASGYAGSRAVRTWEERMKLLEESGFIKTKQVGNQRFKYVAIIHPTTAIEQLRKKGKIPDNWWHAYVARKLETKEASHEQREKKKQSAKNVLPLIAPVKRQSLKKSQTKRVGS